MYQRSSCVSLGKLSWQSFIVACMLRLTLHSLVSISSSSSSSSSSLFVRAMSTSTTRHKLIFHWFRDGDLRLHDNPALVHSANYVTKNADAKVTIVPLVCLDTTNVLGDSVKIPLSDDILKCGPRRAKFWLESVQDLQQQFQAMSLPPSHGPANLVVAMGTPASVFDTILNQLKTQCQDPKLSSYDITVVCQDEVLKEERDAVQSVRSTLKQHAPKAKVETIWGSTLYELKDLPFEQSPDQPLIDMPDVFTPFKNKVEKTCTIKKPLPAPKKALTMAFPKPDTPEYKAIESFLQQPFPTLGDLGYTEEQVKEAHSHDPRGVMEFKGGETAGLARMRDYIWGHDRQLLQKYFETRNGMLGANYSTKFSPWLAHGCLSPRMIAMEQAKYEEQVVANKSTYWVIYELLVRDHCKFFCLKHGDSIFFPSGTIGKDMKWSTFPKNFEKWQEGRTGFPLVDANMRELKATGFMSNRGRQNVCSFLALELKHDWRLGAYWFESALVDYDVYSNWYNWCAGAGMKGGRLNRFNIVKQSKDYDAEGDYVRHWLPELKNVPKEFVHEPWKMTMFQQMEYGVKLGVDYPNPMVTPFVPKEKPHGGRNDSRKGKGDRGRK